MARDLSRLLSLLGQETREVDLYQDYQSPEIIVEKIGNLNLYKVCYLYQLPRPLFGHPNESYVIAVPFIKRPSSAWNT